MISQCEVMRVLCCCRVLQGAILIPLLLQRSKLTKGQRRNRLTCGLGSASLVVTCLMAESQLCTQVGTNPPCCGDIYHFDLSYWAFQNVRTPNTTVSGA